jgi:hypothetical protein
MTNKKSTFTVLTTLTALVGLTALMTTASLIPASQVQARPPVNTPVTPASQLPGQAPVYTPKTPVIPASQLPGQAPVYTPAQHYRSTIQGKLNSNNPGSSQVACSQITVELHGNLRSGLPVPRDGSESLGSGTASGGNLTNGCSYNLVYFSNGKPNEKYKSFHISGGVSGPGLYGYQDFNEVPSIFDFSLEYYKGTH